ncbi:cyclin-D3-1-like isoform X2 [Actinidia eriantha]|uniref:cyclin-D3-1-like isoform X2 n=1 Tax=Actinidia eriantha TaxID=165200 RepID=UPI0025886670|nr:cyclin-D3-1-like isoform X2 [Actinidia eriantha]
MAQSKSLLDALYCEEEHWEEVREDYFGEEERESYYIDDITPNPLPLLEQDLFWEEEELASLLSKEQPNPSYNYFETNPSLDFARREAIEWVLKREKPWMSQLAAVACLSLAAKVEETHVPLLLDLQVEETKYAFEAKTIQRMEILVLSTLQWKMNPVTPLSFLDHITRRLGFKNNLCWEFLRRCESLILCLVSDSRFMCYLPSVLASATMLHIINSIKPCFALDCQIKFLGTLGIDKGKVEDCYKLILESESTFSHRSNKRKFGLGSMPGSPNGVVDVCFSSDSSNDSWAVAASVSSSPEPKKKKIYTQDFEAEDVLSSPR